MKRIITVLFAALFCLCAQTYAQNRADELMKQAQESLAKKEYIKARYLFLQAYNSFASQEKYTQAVECGVNASALYHRENYYMEAFKRGETANKNLKRTSPTCVSASIKNGCRCTSTSKTLPAPKNN